LQPACRSALPSGWRKAVDPEIPLRKTRASPATNAIKANIDGGARGNPGPSAYGVIVRDATGEIIAELSDYLGIQTNNYAEYSGLLAALDFAVREKHLSLKVLSDSELLVRQMQGRYKVKSPGLIDLLIARARWCASLSTFPLTTFCGNTIAKPTAW